MRENLFSIKANKKRSKDFIVRRFTRFFNIFKLRVLKKVIIYGLNNFKDKTLIILNKLNND